MVETVIPEIKSFVSSYDRDGNSTPISFYLIYSGVEALLNQFMDDFNLSLGRTRRLLGLYDNQSINRWLNGTHSMSSLYLGRIVCLYQLRFRGLEVEKINKIEWQEGKVQWMRKPRGEEGNTDTP